MNLTRLREIYAKPSLANIPEILEMTSYLIMSITAADDLRLERFVPLTSADYKFSYEPRVSVPSLKDGKIQEAQSIDCDRPVSSGLTSVSFKDGKLQEGSEYPIIGMKATADVLGVSIGMNATADVEADKNG